MENVRDLREHEIIRRLTARLPGHPLLRTGVGDDCAVVEIPGTGNDQVFTSDPVIEGVHFQSSEEPERVGHKAAGRVLSDIAAMGAQPQWLLVNVVAGSDQDADALEKIYDGMNALCESFGATLIGGDVARGPCLELHVFGTGLLASGTALLRSGARAGEHLFVTGALGCSIEGHHLEFIPRVAEGLFLRESGMVSSMIDISDGLATDLRHILEQSGVGVRLHGGRIPKNGTLDNALYDGEDFELLFTAAAEHEDALRARWSDRFKSELFRIGEITAEPDTLMLEAAGELEVLESKAFEHFSDTDQ